MLDVGQIQSASSAINLLPVRDDTKLREVILRISLNDEQSLSIRRHSIGDARRVDEVSLECEGWRVEIELRFGRHPCRIPTIAIPVEELAARAPDRFDATVRNRLPFSRIRIGCDPNLVTIALSRIGKIPVIGRKAVYPYLVKNVNGSSFHERRKTGRSGAVTQARTPKIHPGRIGHKPTYNDLA